MITEPDPTLASTGIPELDDVLGGGLVPRRMYLFSGDPGSGKTTLGLQFLLEGRDRGESGLYVTLSETREELQAVAASHGWDLEGIHIYELGPPAAFDDPEQEYTMFHPSEVELTETTREILAEVDRIDPRRVVFDSLSEMRLLAQSALRYRRQILALKQYFVGRNATLILLDDRTADAPDTHLQSIAHGVLTLESLTPGIGAERRRLRVAKFRGRQFRGGFHDYRIVRGGIEVFPRLIAAEHRTVRTTAQLSTGIEGLDGLLGGGIEEGSSVLMLGAAGAGKSTIALQMAVAVAERGQQAVVFMFDEAPSTLLERGDALGMRVSAHVEAGRIRLQEIDPAELSPGEFAHVVQRSVGSNGDEGARVVVIDSLNGYLNAMPEEKHLIIQLHELLSFLRQQGVVTIMVLAQSGLVGAMRSPVDASYVADAVLLLRFFEANGEVRQAISVVKKRSGRHERTIREIRFTDRIVIGDALTQFQGVLTGTPIFSGGAAELLGSTNVRR